MKAQNSNSPSANQPTRQETSQAAWWQRLVGTALEGTARQSPEQPADKTLLYDVLSQLDWQNPEAALLKTAGIYSVYQLAGKQKRKQPADTQTENPEITTAQPDTQVCCSTHISAHLRVGLEQYPQAVEELLNLIADLNQRVSAPLLPAILRYGEKYAYSQPSVEAVLGNRGRWLAAQNPDWQYVRQAESTTSPDTVSESDVARWRYSAGVALPSHWESGNKKQRLTAITQWRQVDPAGAREAIAASWKSENWRTRESAVQTFHINLTMSDEPFLEAALSDRAVGVQRSAIACLEKLPESRLCQRMTKRVQNFVRITTTETDFTVEITLPETFDVDWKKDGIEETSADRLSDQASWVAQMLSKTPLNVWESAFENSQAVFAHPKITERDRLILLTGWSRAVCNQKNTQLAKEWVPRLLSQQAFQEWDPEVLSEMLSILPTKEEEQYLRAQMPTKANDQSISHWLQLVAENKQKWDYDFSRLILMRLMQVMKGKRKYGDLFSPPANLALSLHPGLAPEAERMIESWTQHQRPTKAWQRFLDEFLGVLTYRWQMYQLLAQSG